MRKYSTEELVKELERGRGISLGLGASPQVEIWDAIIAKLRAGDALCEAAKKLVALVSPNRYTRCAFSSLSMDHEHEGIRNAIADYEGKA